jgi:hypothetical protein
MEKFEQYLVPEEPAGSELFVFEQTDPTLIDQYQAAIEHGELNSRAKAFARFLSEYVLRANSQGKPMVTRIGDIQRDLSQLSREERYTNSANVLFGVIPDLSAPMGNFPEWFKNDEDISEMRESVEADIAPARQKDPHELAAIGQRLKVITFYEDAKRYFFRDLFPSE